MSRGQLEITHVGELQYRNGQPLQAWVLLLLLWFLWCAFVRVCVLGGLQAHHYIAMVRLDI